MARRINLTQCEMVTLQDDENVKVIDLILVKDPSKRIRYTITARPGGGSLIEADCEDEAWPTMKPYHDLYMAGLKKLADDLQSRLN